MTIVLIENVEIISQEYVPFVCCADSNKLQQC